MDLCSIKHAELGEEWRNYKGRVVFRGDYITDEHGMFAVFTEQGASASHIEAANILDAVARLPGNDGEDADAVGAYTQLTMREAYKLLGTHTPYIETFVTLPKDRQPPSWSNIVDPVCIMDGNLYGHPIAGLLWEIHSHALVKKAGFSPIPSWECLFVHREKQLFLSIYVDDFKLAGKKENIKPMWKTLTETGIELDPPVSLHGDVYLGRAQYNCENDSAQTELHQTLVTRLTTSIVKTTPTTNNIEATMSKMGNNPQSSTLLEDNIDQTPQIPTLPKDPKPKSPPKSKPKPKSNSKTHQSKPLPPTAMTSTTYDHIKSWQYTMKGHAQQSVENKTYQYSKWSPHLV